MGKYLVTVGGVVGLFVPCVTENNLIVPGAMRSDFEKRLSSAQAEIASDFDSISAEINAFLLGSARRTTISTESLCLALYETRLEAGKYVHPESVVTEKDASGKEVTRVIAAHNFTREEKDADKERLGEVVRAFVKSRPEQYHTGKRSGIAIRFVEGEKVTDKEGNPVYDANGDEVQAYRWSDEAWTKMTAKKEKDAPVSVK